MPQGIIRNRYHDYIKTKGKKKITSKRFSKASLNKSYQDDQVVRSSLLSNSTKASQVQMTSIQQQSWIQDYRDCCFLLKQVQICRQQIKKQNAKKLMSAKQQIHQRRICLLAQEATQKLKKCQKKLKNIQLSNNMNPDPHQRKIFTNIIISLAQKIRSSTRQLRNDRQKQLSHQQQIRQYSKSQFDQQIKHLSQLTQQDWLQQQNLQELQDKLFKERNEQIMKIVHSINSLNTIYKQLQDLVIHQGSLLDRIDQNISMTYQNVVKANQHLTKVQNKQITIGIIKAIELICQKGNIRFIVFNICFLYHIYAQTQMSQLIILTK